MTYGFDDDEDEENGMDWGVGVYHAVRVDPEEPSKAQVQSKDAARKLWEDVLKELRRG